MMYVRKAGRMAALSVPALLATPLHASVYPLPADGSPVVGTDTSMQTVYEDTLPDLAHRYSLGYYEIIRANPGVDVWLPGAGTKLLLPGRRILPAGPRTGLVVNLPEHRLYYYPKTRKGEQPVVITYPVSIGKMDWRTPLGDTHVIAKIKHPAWYPPESIRKERSEEHTSELQSPLNISYAVFCLKKKKNTKQKTRSVPIKKTKKTSENYNIY